MTIELKLIAGSTTINLLAGDPFMLRLNGWEPQVAGYNPGGDYNNTIEVVTVKASPSTTSSSNQFRQEYLYEDLKWKLDHIISLLKHWSDDPVTPNRVWLQWNDPGGGSSDVRRALVKSITYKLSNSPFFPPVINQTVYPNLTIEIERFPFWESTNSATMSYHPCLSGGNNTSVDINGGWRGSTGKGRIYRTRFGGITNYSDLWIGFRTNRYGDAIEFKPDWTFTNANTSNDATKSSGIVSWTPADTSLLERMYISMDDVGISSGQRNAQRGIHAVLLRAKSSGTRTFNVRLSDGFYGSGSGNWSTHSRVRVSGSSWIFYALGNISIPPMMLRDNSVTQSILGDYTLRIEAEENTTGTGALQMERMVIIPQSEGFCHLGGLSTSNSARIYIYHEPDNKITAFKQFTSDNSIETPDILDMVDYMFPNTYYEDPRLIGAGTSTADASSNTPGQTFTLTFDLFERHITF